MSTDLTNIYDHPANVIGEWLTALPTPHAERPGGIRAAEILRAHERENSVTFAALHNDTLTKVRDGYASAHEGAGYDPGGEAGGWVALVADLLGLGGD